MGFGVYIMITMLVMMMMMMMMMMTMVVMIWERLITFMYPLLAAVANPYLNPLDGSSMANDESVCISSHTRSTGGMAKRALHSSTWASRCIRDRPSFGVPEPSLSEPLSLSLSTFASLRIWSQAGVGVVHVMSGEGV